MDTGGKGKSPIQKDKKPLSWEPQLLVSRGTAAGTRWGPPNEPPLPGSRDAPLSWATFTHLIPSHTHLNIELNHRSRVPHAHAASHEDDLDHGHDLRVDRQQQGGVGEGAGADKPVCRRSARPIAACINRGGQGCNPQSSPSPHPHVTARCVSTGPASGEGVGAFMRRPCPCRCPCSLTGPCLQGWPGPGGQREWRQT